MVGNYKNTKYNKMACPIGKSQAHLRRFLTKSSSTDTPLFRKLVAIMTWRITPREGDTETFELIARDNKVLAKSVGVDFRVAP